MARFCGKVGYVTSEEVTPGVWKNVVTERIYRGDIVNNKSRWETVPNQINDNISVNADISIVADAYAYQNFAYIKYVEFMDNKWLVTIVTPERPRITLTLGGLYNGQD